MEKPVARWGRWGLAVAGAALLAGTQGSGSGQVVTQVAPAAAPAPVQAAPSPRQAAPGPGQVKTVDPQAVAAGGTIRGTVKAGSVPLPGVAITATNTLRGKKYATTTDLDGNYAMKIPKTGRYVVKAELAAFATVTSEVRLTAEAANQTAAFTLELASQAAKAAAASEQAQTAGLASGLASALSRGTQALSMSGAGEGLTDASSGGGAAQPSLPSLAGLGDAGNATESVAVSGQLGQTNALGELSQDEIQQRINDAVARARQRGGATGDQISEVAGILGNIMNGPGGFGGGGRGGGRGGGGGVGGGAFRRFDPSQPHGSVFYQGGYGDLNALPYSLTGTPEPRVNNEQNRFGITYIGSPYIPHVLKANTKQFIFFNLTGQRNITPDTLYATVPTVAERGGDFTALTEDVSGVSTPVTLYNPATLGVPFGGAACLTAPSTPGCNVIPAGQISQQAQALLKYYPAPNVVTALGSNNTNNYQTFTTAGANSTQASLRYIRNFGQAPMFGQRRRQENGPKTLSQNINFNGSYTGSATDNRNVFLPLGGGTETTGYSAVAGYTVGYGRLRNNASVTWNRSHTDVFNYFTNGTYNPATEAGVPIGNSSVYSNPFYYGVPSLQFSGFTGLTNQSPSNHVNQTISFSDSVGWSHKKHNFRFGLDIRRVHNDVLGGTNVLGQLTFSGCATEAPYLNGSNVPTSQCVPQTSTTTTGTQTSSTSTTTGAGFADFLLGLPQQASVQASEYKLYLRENVYDWYAQDDFRVKPGITLNYGLRYEYFGPFAEKNNRLTNLDHNADYSQVALVTPGEVGPISGIHYPRSLVNGDHALYSPRFGVAWRPGFVKDTVVRAGYGINYNTTQYSRFATDLSDEPPFAVTQTNIANSQGCGQLTLTTAYNCSTAAVQSNDGINPFYRVGHVQVWNVDIQKTLGLGVVLNVGYTGSKGGDLDVVTAPNRTPTGLLNPNVQAFDYENSLAFSRQNNLSFNARKRLQKGVSLQATYTYGHSIDDASSVNGTGNTVAQNPDDLRAEESNSSFDIRQTLTGNFVYELPFGPNRAFLNQGGRVAKTLDGFNVSGTFTFATGGYYTPQYTATACEVSTGTNTSLRPNRNFSVPINGPRTFDEWLNPNAFTAPPCGTYGTASRYSIEGPGTVQFNGALSRTFSFAGDRTLETRMTAINAFNTVQYSSINTTENSQTFGQVNGIAQMRTVTFLARYRF
jgi:hypothetical protein